MSKMTCAMATSCLAALSLTLAACAASTGDELEDVILDVTADDEIEDTVFDQMTAEGKGDGALSYQAVARVVVNAGVSCTGDRVALAIAVVRAESSFNPRITNTVGNAAGIDRGLWQFNSHWHPEVSAACAFSPSCAARAMKRVSRDGTRWREWWTWLNGKHLKYMSASRAAAHVACGS